VQHGRDLAHAERSQQEWERESRQAHIDMAIRNLGALNTEATDA